MVKVMHKNIVSTERSLCERIGRHVFILFPFRRLSTHLLDWFEAPEQFSFPHPPRPEILCYGIGDVLLLLLERGESAVTWSNVAVPPPEMRLSSCQVRE
jgi:hypothetical protein